jgi:hypothetical protein
MSDNENPVLEEEKMVVGEVIDEYLTKIWPTSKVQYFPGKPHRA